MPEQNTKSVMSSKTVWVSLLTLAAGIVTLVSGSDLIAEYPQVVSILAMVSGGIGVVLRVLTNTAIK
jgi:hypothetical protein